MTFSLHEREDADDHSSGSYPWPLADQEVRLALEKAFQDGSWGSYFGGNSEELTAALSDFFSLDHVALCSSGTIAVELALRGCGVEAGDEVILAGYDFPGNFRAVEAIGARPVLVDIKPETWSLDPQQVEEAASSEVKAVLVSYLHGGLADVVTLQKISQKHGWALVEDTCQQPGATVGGKLAGTWGDAAVLSFGGSKLLTAGRGGAVLTADASIKQRIVRHQERGNDAFPLSELQAAVLLPQLGKLRERNQTRTKRLAQVREVTAEAGDLLRPVQINDEDSPAFYKHAWSLVPAGKDPDVRSSLLAKTREAGLPIGEGFRGFAKRSERRCRKPVPLTWSECYANSTLLLHHPILLAKEKAALEAAHSFVDCLRSLSNEHNADLSS
ncbi:MAG: DegT/DnrJ/EryC1/StrS family aminotransferase [Lacipirellulaceae bacterium]